MRPWPLTSDFLSQKWGQECCLRQDKGMRSRTGQEVQAAGSQEAVPPNRPRESTQVYANTSKPGRLEGGKTRERSQGSLVAWAVAATGLFQKHLPHLLSTSYTSERLETRGKRSSCNHEEESNVLGVNICYRPHRGSRPGPGESWPPLMT